MSKYFSTARPQIIPCAFNLNWKSHYTNQVCNTNYNLHCFTIQDESALLLFNRDTCKFGFVQLPTVGYSGRCINIQSRMQDTRNESRMIRAKLAPHSIRRRAPQKLQFADCLLSLHFCTFARACTIPALANNSANASDRELIACTRVKHPKPTPVRSREPKAFRPQAQYSQRREYRI